MKPGDTLFAVGVGFAIFLVIAIMLLLALRPTRAAEVVRMQASMYHEPQPLSCGGKFDPMALTVAHRELPCGTLLRLWYGHRYVEAVVRDWGPALWTKRAIDLSKGTARALRFPGTGKVRVAFWPPLPKPDPRVHFNVVAMGE